MHAATGLGAARNALLASAGMSLLLWSLGEEAWMARMAAEEGEASPLQDAYDAYLADAQTRFARRVDPYEEDLRAWFDFVRVWSAAEDPMDVLGRLRLTPSDVVHLHRVWSLRTEQDPALQRGALKILEEEPLVLYLPIPGPSPPMSLPEATADEELVPSAEELERALAEERGAAAPGAPPKEAAAPLAVLAPLPVAEPGVPLSVTPAASASAAPPTPASLHPSAAPPELTGAKLGLIPYASACALAEVHPSNAAQAWGKHGLYGATLDAEHRAWHAQFEKYPEEHEEFRKQLEHFRTHWRTRT